MNNEKVIFCPKCGEETEAEYMVIYESETMCEGCAQAQSDAREYPLDQ